MFVETAVVNDNSDLNESQPDAQGPLSLLYETFIRRNLRLPALWTWRSSSLAFNAQSDKITDRSIHWAYHLRESLLSQVFEEIKRWKEYLDWLNTIEVLKISPEDPVVYSKVKSIHSERERERARKEAEEQALALEEENNKKLKDSKQTVKKEVPKKDLKKPVSKEQEELEKKAREAEEQRKREVEKKTAADKEEKPKEPEWKSFEIIERQIEGLALECLTSGVFLEAYIDEIQTKAVGEMKTQLGFGNAKEEEEQLKRLLKDVFAVLGKDK
jgi:hypothetical protein